MFSKFKSLLCAAALCVSINPAVNAEVFFVEDQGNRFTVSFPDSWAVINNQKPDDKLTVAGPGVNEYAECRIRVRQDRRFVIFPRKFDTNVQRISYSHEFWNAYLGEYNDVEINGFRDEAGLDSGFASMAESTYETAEGAIVRKKGIAFATLIHDQLYAIECSSEASVYKKWRPAFLSIIKSADFDDHRTASPHGHYRGFLEDKKLEVKGPKELDSYTF